MVNVHYVKGCTSIFVGKNASATGYPIYMHVEDNGPDDAMHLRFYPRMNHKVGELVEGTSAPQVSETYAFWGACLASGTPMAESMPSIMKSDGFLCGMNEYGISIGGNATFSKKPKETKKRSFGGLGISKLVLERCKTAREAVELTGQLTDKYGGTDSAEQGYGGTSCIGAPDGLWIVEHACGKWVSLRCPDDDFIVYANGFQIETEWDLASKDLIDYAVQQGWYNPNSGAPFNFRESYGRRLDDPYNVMREERGRKLLEDKVGSITVKDVIMATRDHYEDTEFASYKIIDTHMHVQTYQYPPHKSPYRTICIPRTQCTMVCHLRDDWPREIGSLMWYSMSSPCSSVYLPIYAGSAKVPKDYLVGEGKYDPESAWWAFDMLQRLADKNYVDIRPYIRTVWDQFEEAEFEQIGRLETIAHNMYQQDPNLAKELISEYTYLQLNTAKNMAKALVHAILRDYDTENVNFETTSTTATGSTAKHDLESP